MKRFLLTSCATALVMTVTGGNSAMAQQNGSYTVSPGTTQQVSNVTDQGSTPTAVSVTGGGVLELDGLNSYTGGTAAAGNSTVRVGQDGSLGAPSGGVTLGDGTSQGILQVGNTVAPNSATSFTSNRAITLNAGGGQVNNFLSGTATLNGPITGSGGLTVNNGTVVLTGNNSYTGQTTVANGAQLVISSDANLGAANVTSNGSTVANTVNLGNQTTGGGSLTIAPGTTSFASARTINVNAGGGILNGLTNGNAAVFSGVVQGGGELAIGGGKVALTNTSNSYLGGTIVQNGATLQIDNDSELGGSGVTQVSLGGADNKSNGTLQYVNTSAVSSVRSFILNGAQNTYDTILTNSAASVTLSGVIAGSAGLNVGGTGTLILGTTNAFLGGVRVGNGATLQISTDGALGGYTSTTNALTGQVTNTADATLNTLHLDGGTLQFGASTTVLHNITTSSAASTIDTQTNNAVINSTISNDGNTVGGIVKIGTGTLTLNGANTYTGDTTINAGTLVIGDGSTANAGVAGNVNVNNGTTLGGSGSVGGTVINNGGTVAPANTLTVGNYIQNSTATLAPVITPNSTEGTASSELKVTGTATIGGGTLSVGYGPGFLRAGQYEIFSASSIAGSGFSTVNAGVVQSAGLTAQVIQEGDSYYVVLTQKADLPDHPNVLPSLTGATIEQAQQTTGALLDRLATARTNALADELAVSMTENHRVRGTSPYGFWVQPVGSYGSQSSTGGIAGYNTQGEGFLMGADTEWAPGISIGVAFGYTHTSLTEDGGASGTNSTPLLAVYGGWWRGAYAVDALVGIGMGEIDGSRPLNLPLAGTTTPVNQVATSSHNANQKIAAVQGSAAWAFDGWVVGPQLGAKYLNLRETSYTETGTDIYNFTVASNSVNSLRPFASADVTKRFFIGDHWALVPDVKIGFEHEVNQDVRKINAQTQGDAQLWVFNGLLPGANILRFVGGLKLELNRTEAFYVSFDRQQSSTGDTQYVTGGFRYRL